MLDVAVLRSGQTNTSWGREFRSAMCYVKFCCIPNIFLSISWKQYTFVLHERRNTVHRDLCFLFSKTQNSACKVGDNDLMSLVKCVKWGRMLNCAIMCAIKPKLQLTFKVHLLFECIVYAQILLINHHNVCK